MYRRRYDEYSLSIRNKSEYIANIQQIKIEYIEAFYDVVSSCIRLTSLRDPHLSNLF